MPDMRGVARCAWAQLVVAALVAVVGLVGCGGGSGAAASSPAVVRLAPATPVSSLPAVAVSGLPPQAVETLALIQRGGPFPYSKDGATFGNRERLLPQRPSGFYQEYTVRKPGESDRGPWRIVTGKDGSRFWTDDHYASFEEVVQP